MNNAYIIKQYQSGTSTVNPVTLNAHHIKEVAKHPDLIYDVDNGVTLCKECHDLIHNKRRNK